MNVPTPNDVINGNGTTRNNADIFTSLATQESTHSHINGTDVVVRDEVRIETVIIILWATGGVLLLTLLILLVCILRNSKKNGLGCSGGGSVFRIQPRAQHSGNGSLNHGYTSYDEIWTWIPIIRGGQDECPTQDTSVPVFTTSTSSALHRQLEPPPYSVAIATPPSSHISSSNTHSTRVPSSANVQNQRNPVSTSDIQSVSGLNLPQEPRTVTVTSSSEVVVNNLVNSALSSNRNSQIQSADAPNDQRPHNVSLTDQQSHGLTNNHVPNVQSPSISRHQSPENNQSRSSRNLSQMERNDNGSRIVRNHSPYLSERRSTREFTYDPNERMYSFVTGESGRRIWCDIPPSLLEEDGPPPYSAGPNYPGRRSSNRNGQSLRNTHRQNHNYSENGDRPCNRRQSPDQRDSPGFRERNRSTEQQNRIQSRSSLSPRNQMANSTQYDMPAPIVRFEYDYF